MNIYPMLSLQVARRESPIEDAIVIQEIREVVGYQIHIRVDANQMWTYKEALQFASLVKDFDLAYIEVLCMILVPFFLSFFPNKYLPFNHLHFII